VPECLGDDPVDPADVMLYHKNTCREPYDRRRRRRPDVDDVIMVNLDGELTEVTLAALGVRLDGGWFTPPLTSGCLPGVERGRLLDLGVLHERVLHASDLDDAQGLAVISSLRGWREARLVRSIDDGTNPRYGVDGASSPPAQVTTRTAPEDNRA
jgi:para-aminobenzoate synthetase/4-amino-4-deoxychorismate lyase